MSQPMTNQQATEAIKAQARQLVAELTQQQAQPPAPQVKKFAA